MKKLPYKYESASLILAQDQYGKFPLILGDAQAPNNRQLLAKYSIKVIISIGEEAAPKNKLPTLKYHLIKLRDQKDQPIFDYFDKVTDLIEENRKNFAVLIHCYHGVSRSASFVIGYMMRKLGIPFVEAKQFVKKKRGCISPNPGFLKQLAFYEECKPCFMEKTQPKMKQGIDDEKKEQFEN